MSYFYKVPERIRAAQWSATSTDKQSQFLSLLLSAGVDVEKVSNEQVCFDGKDARPGEWVVIPGDGTGVQVMNDWSFTSLYHADPQMEADRRHDSAEEDSPEEEEEES